MRRWARRDRPRLAATCQTSRAGANWVAYLPTPSHVWTAACRVADAAPCAGIPELRSFRRTPQIQVAYVVATAAGEPASDAAAIAAEISLRDSVRVASGWRVA